MNIFSRQKAGMDVLTKYQNDQGKLFSEYAEFHKAIQRECQTVLRLSRIKNGILTKEHNNESNGIVSTYENKRKPAWRKFKNDQKDLYDQYVKDAQKYEYYPDKEDGKD